MRIALDARALTGPFTGDRTYWRNLIRSLAETDTHNEYILYSRKGIPEEDIPTQNNFSHRLLPSHSDRTWTLIELPRALRRDNADLVHVQYTSPPKALCPCPVVTTVHDISFRLYPQWFPVKDRFLMNLTVPISMRAANCVITDSECSRRDIQRIYHIAEDRLFSIPLGLSRGMEDTSHASHDELQRRARCLIAGRYGIDQPFILALGVLQPRKNLEMLAASYGKLKQKYGVPHLLVLVGKAGWLTARESILNAAKISGGDVARDGVMFPGYVPDEELPAWYRACSVFAHPALYEGFGITPLEAMACGAPVLVSNAPALSEVVGDCALVASATDPDAWSEALYRLLSDKNLTDLLVQRGPVRAAMFSWSTTAAKTSEVYRLAVE